MNKIELPKRKKIRLNEYDYGQAGAYFITICTYNRAQILSKIVGEGLCALPQINLTPIGEIVKQSIEYINNNYDNVLIDKYVIMPNHVHLIIHIQTGGHVDPTGGHGDPPLRVYDIIGRFKSFTDGKYNGRLWQRSFYDHIIRDENDYLDVCNYIDQNPLKWADDCYYTEE